MSLTLFDSHVTLGPRSGMLDGEPFRLAHILEAMDRNGVDAALVGSTHATAYDPMWANRWLSEQLDGHPRLFPLWTAFPPHAGDSLSPSDFVRQARRAGVRAVRLHPLTHGYSTAPSVLRPLMRALADEGLAVLIHRDQFVTRQDERAAGYERLTALCRDYRACRVLLLGAHWSDVRSLLPSMDACPNLHTDLSCLQINQAPEYLARRTGASRLVYGSGGPLMSMGAARALVDWAELPLADRQKIAGGNLRRLLGVRALPAVAKRPPDDLAARMWAGRPLDQIEILDAHAHICHQGAQGAGVSVMPGADGTSLRRLFRRIGIRRSAVSSWIGIFGPAPVEGNEITWQEMQRARDFLIGYACMDPVQMTPRQIEEEIRLRHGRQGFLGLKPYIRTSAAFDDPRYARWYRHGAKHRLFALFHCAHEVAAKLGRRHPGLQILLAHSGSSMASARKAAGLARDNPNVFCEITFTTVTEGAIEEMVRIAGAGHVLFGTDSPMRDPRPQLGWVVGARLSRADKAKILGANFARILQGIRL